LLFGFVQNLLGFIPGGEQGVLLVFFSLGRGALDDFLGIESGLLEFLFAFAVGWILSAAMTGSSSTPGLVAGDRLIAFSDVVEIVDIDRRDRQGAVLTVKVVGQRRYPWDAQTQRGWMRPRGDA